MCLFYTLLASEDAGQVSFPATASAELSQDLPPASQSEAVGGNDIPLTVLGLTASDPASDKGAGHQPDTDSDDDPAKARKQNQGVSQYVDNSLATTAPIQEPDQNRKVAFTQKSTFTREVDTHQANVMRFFTNPVAIAFFVLFAWWLAFTEPTHPS